MHKKRLSLAILITALVWAMPAFAERLVIPGSGSSEVILSELATAFNAGGFGHQVTVPPSTGPAVRGIETNEVVLGRVSRRPSEADARKGIRYLVFARDAVVFATGSGVSVKNVSTAEAADIFSGTIVDWRQLGGPAAPIRLFVRERYDSKFEVIQTHLKPFQTLAFGSRGKMLYHSYEMLGMLDRFDMGIGWLTRSSLAGAKTRLGALSLDGVEPSVENVASGKYKLVIDFGFIYKDERLNDAARAFLDYVYSESGRRILEKNVLVPVARPRS